MNRLVALNSSAHRHLRVDQSRVLSQASRLNMLPVVLSEFLKLCAHYPIVLTKNGATGRFTCVALFGIEKQENLFWRQDRWDALYVPLQVTRQPFFLATDQDRAVCIDMENPAVGNTQGEIIFDEHGTESAYLQQVKLTLAALLEGEGHTERFLGKLLQLELICPMRLDIELIHRQKLRVDGLYTVDETRLKALRADAVAELHALDYLAPIYTMLASLGHLHLLIQRKNQCSV